MATNEHSGYPTKWFKDQEAARDCFECAICVDVLKDPVQIRNCGHQFCGLCMDDILKSDSRCPSCRNDISHAMIFKDHAANRLIRKLIVNCPNEGCCWSGELRGYLEDHEKTCTFLISTSNNNSPDFETLTELFESRLKEEIVKLRKELLAEHDTKIKEMQNKHDMKINQMESKHSLKIFSLELKNSRLCEQVNSLTNSKIFVMKICDFNNLLCRAKSTHSDGSIYSQPFLSSDFGYMMKVRICLNEEGIGYTGYMGVYIVLMKSDHDGLLTWPFSKKVTFILVDQQDDEHQRQDELIEFIPNGEKEMVRPKGSENKGRGFPQFVLHSQLRTRKYIKDNTVYIKVIVNN